MGYLPQTTNAQTRINVAKKPNYSFEKRAKETAKQNKKAEKQLRKEERKAAASVDAEQVQPLEE